jgi:ketosteroid isomerase-like protein
MDHNDTTALIHRVYAAFNRRAVDEVLSCMHPGIHWPNGWEGGYVDGHQAVRDYWSRQWAVLDPEVIPLQLEWLTDNQVRVLVRQIVKDRDGNLLSSGDVNHVYTFDQHLIKTMTIESI